MRVPSNSPITLGFGAITDPYSPASPHMGTDFAHIPDNTIYAPFSGTVKLIPNNSRDGNGIYMYNGNQFHGMLHSSKYLVSNGANVTEGQPIGIMGDTGYAFGVHLHWCVKVNNQFIDPMSLVKEREMPSLITDDTTNLIYDAMLHRNPEGQQVYDAWRGQPVTNMLQDVRKSDEWKSLVANEGDLTNFYNEVIGRAPNANDISYHLNRYSDAAGQQVGSWKEIAYDAFQRSDFLPHIQAKTIADQNKVIDDLKAQLAKAGETLDPKTQAKLDRIDQSTADTKGMVQKIIDLLLSKFTFSKKK